MAKSYWVSITGLELKSVFRYPQFMMYAVPSFAQAQASPGNVWTDARGVNGIQHTLTVWESRRDMLNYLRQGAHLDAMKASKSVGQYGKVYGYNSAEIPTWSDALELWHTKGRVVLGQPKKEDLIRITSSSSSSSQEANLVAENR